MPWQPARADIGEEDPGVRVPQMTPPATASEPPVTPHTENQSTISELLKRKHTRDTVLPTSQDPEGIIEISPSSDHVAAAPQAVDITATSTQPSVTDSVSFGIISNEEINFFFS